MTRFRTRAYATVLLLLAGACTTPPKDNALSDRLADQFVARLEREFPKNVDQDDFADGKWHRDLVNLELFAGVGANLPLDQATHEILQTLWRPGPMRFRLYATAPNPDALWEEDSASYLTTVRQRFRDYYAPLAKRAAQNPDDELSRGLLAIGTLTLLSASINYDKKCELQEILANVVLDHPAQLLETTSAKDARARAMGCQDLALWDELLKRAEVWLQQLETLNRQSKWFAAARYYFHPAHKMQILGPKSCMGSACKSDRNDDPGSALPAARFAACDPIGNCKGWMYIPDAKGELRQRQPPGVHVAATHPAKGAECAYLLIPSELLSHPKRDQILLTAWSKMLRRADTIHHIGLQETSSEGPWRHPKMCAVPDSACENTPGILCEALRAYRRTGRLP